MKNRFLLWCLLLGALTSFGSCLDSDEEDVTLYDDAAITQFSISSAKIIKHTLSSAGADSTYYVDIANISTYNFSIDQMADTCFISNRDSLPYGTDATKLLVSYSTKNSGLVFIENENNDSIKIVQTTDTLDFTNHRYLRVYSTDGTNMRRYKVKVNIHHEDGAHFAWHKVGESQDIASLDSLHLVYAGGKLITLGLKNGATETYSSQDGITWTHGATLSATAYRNATVRNDTLFVLDGNTLKYSTDGEAFTDIPNATSLSALTGCSSKQLYALAADGTLMASAKGIEWTAESIDDSLTLLPNSNISSCTFTNKAGNEYVVMAGSRTGKSWNKETYSQVWTKTIDGITQAPWNYIPIDREMLHPMPRVENLTIVAYGTNMLAFFGKGIDNNRYEPYSTILLSRDGGITWKQDELFAYPADDTFVAAPLSVIVDSNDYLWMVCTTTGQVWRGKLNNY